MKLLFAASTAGLAALFLLVPTAYGLQYYECESSRVFGYQVISSYAKSASPDIITARDPIFDGGEIKGAYRFTSNQPDGTPTTYLIQTVNVEPYQRLFESSEGQWRICTPKNGHL
ncbi:BgTH12-07819 [Blumeria graminis f. sp. triticale]|uniref:Bgt-51743 n=2 Tax=Blumeria graminis TaxID=34373 RepID=A0A9X9QGM7_BLUGR|nr:BgTH12-07819 [Blumeria graminis f. sp. triticale]VDB96451.1 Bgt-51743 [Blumeria graminis f. sp. tritici]